MKLARKHLLGLEGISRSEIEVILNATEAFK